MRNIRILATAGIICLMLFNVGCGSGHNFDDQLNAITKSYHFSIAGWEFSTFWEKDKQTLIHSSKSPLTDTEITNQFISLNNQINDLKNQINASNQSDLQSRIDNLQKQQNDLTGAVEDIIKRQVTHVLSEMGIYQPWLKYNGLRFVFPPPDFKLESAPHLLVVSPRDKISTLKDVLIKENISPAEIASLETNVDDLNVSSLVVDLGGVGTYPNLVSSDSDFQHIIETCAHEWVHAYLAFQPLGFRYVLNITGLTHNDDISTMNETVADIIGKEVGAAVVKEYYPQFQSNSQNVQTIGATTVNQPVFNFNQEMQTIRKQVDQYLAAGEIDTAEQYMQQKQQYLAANGYYIRKLNQAYFAFYGTYADSPAYENPIGTEIMQLRTQSASLKDFLNTVSAMTSVNSLNSALK